MLSMLIGVIGAIIGLVGYFYFQSVPLLVIGTGLYIVETLMEWKNLNPNSKVIDVVIFIVGGLIGMKLKVPFYVGGMIAINIYSALCVAGGLLIMGTAFKKKI